MLWQDDNFYLSTIKTDAELDEALRLKCLIPKHLDFHELTPK